MTPLRRAFLSAFVVALILSPLAWIGLWQSAEQRAFDLLSTISPPKPPEPGAVIVAVDEPSFAEFQRQWPWPRSLHAHLIEALRRAGATTIAIDIIFAEPAADPEEDQSLVAAMGPDILLAAEDTVIETTQAVQMMRVEPLPELLARGARAGIASVSLDGDQVLRQLPDAGDGFARALAPQADPPPGALIQYFGPPRSYPTVSYYQALDPVAHLPDGYFRDKTVIVGLSLQNTAVTAKRLPDSFATSFTASTGLLTAGPEVQATIVDNMRHGLYIRSLPSWISALFALVAALLAGLAVPSAHPWRAGATALGGVVVVAALSYGALRLGRVWLPPLLPAAAVLLAVAAEVVRGYLAERAARRQITEAFGHYLAPSLVDRLARDPSHLRLGGERRRLTVLFCDIRGFTTIAERLKHEPERLTALVNRVLTVLSDCVLAHGGTIDKYIGDCVMAFWNAPLDDSDHAMHAVEAARSMQRAIRKLNRELSDAGQEPVAVGIGINTGECIVGNLGSSQRFDYTAIGDTVNLAARLEGLCRAHDTGILMGAETAQAIAGRIETRKLASAAVAGRNEPVDVYALASVESG